MNQLEQYLEFLKRVRAPSLELGHKASLSVFLTLDIYRPLWDPATRVVRSMGFNSVLDYDLTATPDTDKKLFEELEKYAKNAAFL